MNTTHLSQYTYLALYSIKRTVLPHTLPATFRVCEVCCAKGLIFFLTFLPLPNMYPMLQRGVA